MSRHRPAQPESDPDVLLRHELDSTLQVEAADIYAGMTLAPDGTIQLRVITSTPAVEAVIERVISSVRSAYPDVPGTQAVEQIVGAKNSLRALQQVHDRVTARSAELRARGIRLTGWGVDIWMNRVGIGVQQLTPETKEFLEEQFGPDQVDVIEGDGGWRALGGQGS